MRQELGFGPYVVENLGRLLGRFDGLGLDSWCRAKFVKLFGKPRGDLDKAIAKKYAGFGEWRGLALWLDLTRDWHGDGKFGAGKFVLAK
jgi:N-glycosylase/DNA lyase